MDAMTGTMRRPRIGISAWRRTLPTFLGEHTDLYTLGVEYVDAVRGAGGLPLILPHDAGRAEEILDTIDGLVLSGGDDIHPVSYGEPYSEASVGIDRGADDWEIALVRGAAVRGMPALGICRGMQIMAVAFGGRLVQDMAGLEGHPDIHQLSPDDILTERHAVQLSPACALAAIYGETSRDVNTIHHQAVTDAGRLTVAGHGPGGVIEAVEPDWAWPAIGVQWHPEKLDGAVEGRLFEHLILAAATYMSRGSAAAPGALAQKEQL
jgi:putative glutamine amidotransferase